MQASGVIAVALLFGVFSATCTKHSKSASVSKREEAAPKELHFMPEVILQSLQSRPRERAVCETGTKCGDGFCCCDNTTAVCSGQGLTYIPDLPVDIIQLDFSDNNLTRLTEGTLRNLSSLQTLIVRKNQIASIHPNAFQDMGLLITVDLSGNQLSDFDEMAMGLKSAAVLEKLDANHNDFEDLPLASLSRIPGLLLLFLSGNKIRSVSKRKSQTTIGNSSNLHSLDLRTNRFSEFPNFCRNNGSGESYLPKLRTLEIQWNQITNTDSRSLACLPELVALRMDGNPVYHIHRDFFGGLPGLQFVTMTFCTSRTIDEYAFRHPTIQHLDVSENLWFLRRAGDSGTDPGLFLDMPQLRFINMSWTVFRYWDKGLSDEMLMSISNLTSFVVQGTGLDHIPQTILKHFRNLEFLGVRENEIAFLPENMFENLTALRALDLSHNHLTTISQTWMESFLSPADPVSIDLSGNPFSCTCDQLWFIELYKKDIKRDPDERIFQAGDGYKCSSPDSFRGVDLADVDITSRTCMFSYGTYLVILFVTIFTVVVLVVTALVYRFRWRLRFLLYTLQHYLTRDRPLDESPPPRFDVFVSYDTSDSQWVLRVLQPELEGRRGLRLCLHERDFVPGRFISHNIIERMQESAAILPILSNSFLRSDWCRFELFVAVKSGLAHAQRPVPLVPILLEDLDREAVDSFVCTLLNTTTYLAWPSGRGEEERGRFWRTLCRALSRSTGREMSSALPQSRRAQ